MKMNGRLKLRSSVTILSSSVVEIHSVQGRMYSVERFDFYFPPFPPSLSSFGFGIEPITKTYIYVNQKKIDTAVQFLS